MSGFVIFLCQRFLWCDKRHSSLTYVIGIGGGRLNGLILMLHMDKFQSIFQRKT